MLPAAPDFPSMASMEGGRSQEHRVATATHPTSLGMMLPRRHRAGNAGGSNRLRAAAPCKAGQRWPPVAREPRGSGAGICRSLHSQQGLGQERVAPACGPSATETRLQPKGASHYHPVC